MDFPTLWPAPDEVAVDHILADAQSLTLIIHTCRAVATCPICGQPAFRVHSRYQRTLADLPWHGVTVLLRLQTRYYGCKRAVFSASTPLATGVFSPNACLHWL